MILYIVHTLNHRHVHTLSPCTCCWQWSAMGPAQQVLWFGRVGIPRDLFVQWEDTTPWISVPRFLFCKEIKTLPIKESQFIFFLFCKENVLPGKEMSGCKENRNDFPLCCGIVLSHEHSVDHCSVRSLPWDGVMSAYFGPCRCTLDPFPNKISIQFWWFLYDGWLMTMIFFHAQCIFQSRRW